MENQMAVDGKKNQAVACRGESPEVLPPEQKSVVRIDDRGLLAPTTIDEAFRLAKAYHVSKLLPQRYTSPEMVLTAMQFLTELKLKPLTAMRQLAVIQGTPSLFGDLPLSLCYSSGLLESLKEWLIDEKGREICNRNENLKAVPWGAVCVVKRKGDPEPLERTFTMDDARGAGLLNSPTWKTYPKRMLTYRARSQALKDKFPDALNGISIAEYDFNALPDTDPDQATSAAPRSRTRGVVGESEDVNAALDAQVGGEPQTATPAQPASGSPKAETNAPSAPGPNFNDESTWTKE